MISYEKISNEYLNFLIDSLAEALKQKAQVKDLIEIKTCPYCEGKAKLIDEVKQEGHGLYYHRAFVKCNICQAQGPIFYEKESDEYEFLALNAWNEGSII